MLYFIVFLLHNLISNVDIIETNFYDTNKLRYYIDDVCYNTFQSICRVLVYNLF